MEDHERIERDTTDIANAAKDIDDQERGIVADDAEAETLKRRLAEVDADREARRGRQRDDDRIIDDRSRDLKDAFGHGDQPAPPPPPPAPGPGAPPNPGPVAGPGNPPVTPPRRVG